MIESIKEMELQANSASRRRSRDCGEPIKVVENQMSPQERALREMTRSCGPKGKELFRRIRDKFAYWQQI